MTQGLVILMALTCFLTDSLFLRDELRILSKRLAFAGNPWCFAICKKDFEKCNYCSENVVDDSRNVPKRLRKKL